MIYLSADQILFIHARLIVETGGSHGVRDLGMLLSAVGRSQVNFDDQDLYSGLFSKTAALMESLILKHPFVDGNKRTGVTSAGLFLRRNGYRLTASNADLVTITMKIAQSKSDLEELTFWIRENSQPIK
jgi:death-on-curing protein